MKRGGKALGGVLFVFIKEGIQDWIFDFDLNEVRPKAVYFGWETTFSDFKIFPPPTFLPFFPFLFLQPSTPSVCYIFIL